MVANSFNFFGDIDKESIVLFEEFLRNLDSGVREVELNIHSYGGDCFVAFGIIDLIKSRSEIRFISNILGLAASAAALIALACDVVRMSELGTIMLHSAHSDGGEESALGVGVANERQKVILSRRLSDGSLLDGLVGGSNWVGAVDALKLGLIDEIISNNKTYGTGSVFLESDKNELVEKSSTENNLHVQAHKLHDQVEISNNCEQREFELISTESTFSLNGVKEMEEKLKKAEELLEEIKTEASCAEGQSKEEEPKVEAETKSVAEIEVEGSEAQPRDESQLDVLTLVEKLLERVEALEKRLLATENVVEEGVSEDVIAARVKSIYARAAVVPSKAKATTKDNKNFIEAYKNFILG